MKQQTGLLSFHKSNFNKLPKIGRHKKRIQKKLLKKLGYPYFRYSRKSGFYSAVAGLQYLANRPSAISKRKNKKLIC
ncbi:hypothetical protein DY124_06210 [Apilactobacillus micheneri]|uniref:hypothetical protein n=1 Tax=Apilactobacillus micheneri TaxID=1899430 RepID=UPI001128C802|nr:hypothetical protein [Apilactobacillus micheneri]TPR43167.1 hypothetical protein DY124_06210 [Apilactobacillus micheneri]TPR47255.1 hypothetical protein DY125_06705 [Apilactobacillus micheneri]